MASYLMDLVIKAINSKKDEKGQALVEYSLVLLLIAMVVFLMLGGIGGNVNNTYSTMNSAFSK